jgi:predicted P-loop ATPase
MKKIEDKRKVIQQYTDAGFFLVKLKGKSPVEKDWVNINKNKSIEYYLDSNFGVVLKDTDLVIDVDPRNFEKGDNPLQRLSEDLGLVLNTYVVESGGGGLHIYLKKDKDVCVVKKMKKYQGIDIRTKGGQMVAPTSIHPDTKKEYKIQRGNLDNIQRAPEKLIELIETKAIPIVKTERINAQLPSDSMSLSERYIAYLQEVAPLAIEGKNGDLQTFKVACRGRDYSLSEEVTFKLMINYWNDRCTPAWTPKELREKVRNAYKYNEDEYGKRDPKNDFNKIQSPAKLGWDLTANNAIKKTLSNAINYFIMEESPRNPLLNMLAYNEFSREIEFKKQAPWHKGNFTGGAWTDTDAINCKYYLSALKHFDIPIGLIHEAVVVVAQKNSYHPVRNYLNRLRWDRESRLDTWLTEYAGVEENAYTNTIGKKILIAAVARVFDPGCKFDHVLILEGKQEIGKSFLCSILGGEWYCDLMLDPHNRRTVENMRGKWIVEISEMECARRAEANALKSFITRTVDRDRMAYCRNAEDFPRQNIFIGTINPEAVGYLKDVTGNRRFWPVFCKDIKIEELKEVRDQLFAEAKLHYDLGEDLYIKSEPIKQMARKEVRERQENDPWTEEIREWLDEYVPGLESKRLVVTSKEIWHDCLDGYSTSFGRVEQSRISNIMKFELGWTKGTHYCSVRRKTISGYKRPEYIF